LLHVLCTAVLLSFGVLSQFKLKPKVLVAQYDAVAIERIKAEWMQSPLWLKDYHILLNGIQSLQNDNNMLRRNLLNEGEIGVDASFKQRRLAAAEQSIFDGITNQEREQWIDIMSRIKWASLNVGDRRRLTGDGEYAPESKYVPILDDKGQFRLARDGESAPAFQYKPALTLNGKFIFPYPLQMMFTENTVMGKLDVIFDPLHDPALKKFISSCSMIQGQNFAGLFDAALRTLHRLIGPKPTDEWRSNFQRFIKTNTIMPIGEFIKNRIVNVRIFNALYSVCLNSVSALTAKGYFIWQSVDVSWEEDNPYAVVLWYQADRSDKFMFDAYLSRLHGVKWDDAVKGCGEGLAKQHCDIFGGLMSNVKSGEIVKVDPIIPITYPNVEYFTRSAGLFD